MTFIKVSLVQLNLVHLNSSKTTSVTFVEISTISVTRIKKSTVSSLHIYNFIVSRAFMAGAASQTETLTPPGHLVSPLVCRGP